MASASTIRKREWRKAHPIHARMQDKKQRVKWRKANPETVQRINEGKKQKRRDERSLNSIFKTLWW